MNLYFLVEGKQTEKRVYRAWLGHVFPHLEEAARPEDVVDNHFFILGGKGYPSYIQRIHNALQDLAHYPNFDHFLIGVDTEGFSVAEKRQELTRILAEGPHFANTHLILHHCCIETWFLGHPKMLRRNPHSEKLRRYKAFFDVSQDDPEMMGLLPPFEKRAQFHFDYLREMLREKGLRYSETKPGETQEAYYLQALVERHENTGHLATFGELVKLWRSWHGAI